MLLSHFSMGPPGDTYSLQMQSRHAHWVKMTRRSNPDKQSNINGRRISIMLTGLSLPQRLARAVRRTWASRCGAVIALALVPLVASLLTVTSAEASEILAPAITTIFLADPKLGIAGAIQSGDSTDNSISGDSIGSAARAYDVADATRVAAGRDSQGNLTAIYLGASVSTFAASTTGGSEISVEIASTSGAPVAYLFDGNNVPNAWNAKAFPAHPSAITDPIEYYKGVGTAVRGALLLGRYSPVATAAEANAITRIAADLRNRLLPVPTSDAATATAPTIYTSKSGGDISTRL
jgi:hypothetical protein